MKKGNGFDYRLKKKQFCPKKQLKNVFNLKKHSRNVFLI